MPLSEGFPPHEGFSHIMDLEKTLEVPDEQVKAIWTYFEEENWNAIQALIHTYLDSHFIPGNVAPMIKNVGKESAVYEPYMLIRAARDAVKASGVVSLEQDVRAILVYAGYNDTRYHILLSGKRASRPPALAIQQYGMGYVVRGPGDPKDEDDGDSQEKSPIKMQSPRVIDPFPGLPPRQYGPDGELLPTPVMARYIYKKKADQNEPARLEAEARRAEMKKNSTVKHLTCWYWLNNLGGCTKKAEDCLYAHENTGRYADQPRALRPGGPALAGKNLERNEAHMHQHVQQYPGNVPINPYGNHVVPNGAVNQQGMPTMPRMQGYNMPAYPHGPMQPGAPMPHGPIHPGVPMYEPSITFPPAIYQPPAFNAAYQNGGQSFHDLQDSSRYNPVINTNTVNQGAVYQQGMYPAMPYNGTAMGGYPAPPPMHPGMNAQYGAQYPGMVQQGYAPAYAPAYGVPAPSYNGYPEQDMMDGGAGGNGGQGPVPFHNIGFIKHDGYGNNVTSNMDNGFGTSVYGNTAQYHNTNVGVAGDGVYGNTTIFNGGNTGLGGNGTSGITGLAGNTTFGTVGLNDNNPGLTGTTGNTGYAGNPPKTPEPRIKSTLKPNAPEFVFNHGNNNNSGTIPFPAYNDSEAQLYRTPTRRIVPSYNSPRSRPQQQGFTVIPKSMRKPPPKFDISHLAAQNFAGQTLDPNPPSDEGIVENTVVTTVKRLGGQLPQAPKLTGNTLKLHTSLESKPKAVGIGGQLGTADKDLMTAFLNDQIVNAGIRNGSGHLAGVAESGHNTVGFGYGTGNGLNSAGLGSDAPRTGLGSAFQESFHGLGHGLGYGLHAPPGELGPLDIAADDVPEDAPATYEAQQGQAAGDHDEESEDGGVQLPH